MSINVSGGVPPYTVFVTDQAPPAQYSGPGPSFTHTIQSRRCFNWINEVRIQDSTGQLLSQNFSVDPDLYFPGGCLESDPP
jgi:hypothetical protein